MVVYDVSSIVSKNRNVSDGKLFPYGKSNFGAYTRGQQHLAALARQEKHQENAIVRHRVFFHREEEEFVKYRMEVVKCFNRPMQWTDRSARDATSIAQMLT